MPEGPELELENMEQVDKEMMLFALRSTLENAEDGTLTKGEYHYKLVTYGFEQQMAVERLTTCFKAVEEESMTEDDYFFELISPSFFYTKLLVGWNSTNISIIRWLSVLLLLDKCAVALPVNTEHSPVTLTAGSNGIVPFACRKTDPFAAKSYSLHLEGKDIPFFIDGVFVPEGLMSTDQAERFDVAFVENDQEMSIEINIAQVSVEDQGTYIAILIVQGDTTESHVMKRAVMIVIPPGPAICFLLPSEIFHDRHEIHCHSERGSGDSTLTCFQEEDKIPYFQVGEEQSDSQIVYRRRFWMLNTDVPVYCCSHDVKEIVTIKQKSCNQFRFPPGPNQEPEISTTLKPHTPTKIAPITKPINMEENNNLSSENSSISGSDRNVDKSSLIISLMFSIIYLIIQ
ncbi:uncharacterized protein LOC121412467 [Lytechinus variegatus]|uniref:uncharacterized protein LOC121412467 n=1 Tax=Lytechinus variegatus TaxID=7654 RepID=UPI001BB218C7|nr:uncharacterized protein LOC121412467 [Lytechinus variegatus]